MKVVLMVTMLALTVVQGICQDQNTKLAVGISYVPAVNWLWLSDRAEATKSSVFELKPRIAHSVGIIGKYNVTPKFSVSTGIYRMDYGYNFDLVNIDFPVPLAYPTGQYKVRAAYLDLPIQLGLTVIESDKADVYIKAGGAISWLQNERITFHTSDGVEERDRPKVIILAKTLYSVRLGVGSMLPITRKLQIDIYPNVRRTVTNYKSGGLGGDNEKVHFQAIALDATLWYNF